MKIATLFDIPDRWMLITVDALQNWRAALNHLTWKLAILNLKSQGVTRDPKWNTEFPIATEPGNFRSNKVADLSAGHRTIIEKLQPYHRGNFAPSHPLAILQKITNTDKHRTFQIGAAATSETVVRDETAWDCVITHVEHFLFITLEVGAEWARYDVTPTGPDPCVQMDQSISLTIAFENGRLVWPALTSIGNEVDLIVRIFEDCF
jgi:hypothetical protein